MPSRLDRRLALLESLSTPATADVLRERAYALTDSEELLAVVDGLHELVTDPDAPLGIGWANPPPPTNEDPTAHA